MSIIVATIGLGFLLSFASSVRSGFSVPLGKYLSLLMIPAAISLLWFLATQVGWWTAAIFVVASLLVGALNAAVMRSNRATLVSVQPLTGVVFCVAAVICWLLPT